MLRRLTLGLAGLSLAAVIAACNSSTAALNNGLGVGPNFAPQTLYVANASQNAIDIYAQGFASGASPSYQIGGSTTSIDGPQYLTFDTGDAGTELNKSLWITNYNPSTQYAEVLVIKYLATGNVYPLNAITYGELGQPRGIAIDPTNGEVAVAVTYGPAVSPALPDQIQIYPTDASGDVPPNYVITGSATGLNVPSGIAYDGHGNVFVANRQGGSVESFVLPSPSPTPSTSPTPSPTPTPTSTPSTSASSSPSPTPSPVPTAEYYFDETPLTAIAGSNTGLVNPTGVTLDGSGNVYVVDAGNPSVREFSNGATGNVAPTRVISGSNTLLSIPLDVKIDSSGTIYVSDPGAGKVLIFSSTASGNVAPTSTLPIGTGVMGLGLSP